MFAGLAGADPNAGAFWAQNQAINNDAGSPEHTADAVKGGVLSTLNILLSLLMPALPGNPVMEVARNQFVDLMNAHAKRKMSEPPEQLIAEGVANGWTAVGGAGGGRPPTSNPGTVLVNGMRGAESASGMGMPGYVPDNVMLDSGRDETSDRQSNPNKGESPVWKELRSAGNSVKTDGKRYFEWDYTHNDIEVYNKRGEHIGSMDPVSGEIYKPAVPGRKLNNR